MMATRAKHGRNDTDRLLDRLLEFMRSKDGRGGELRAFFVGVLLSTDGGGCA